MSSSSSTPPPSSKGKANAKANAKATATLKRKRTNDEDDAAAAAKRAKKITKLTAKIEKINGKLTALKMLNTHTGIKKATKKSKKKKSSSSSSSSNNSADASAGAGASASASASSSESIIDDRRHYSTEQFEERWHCLHGFDSEPSPGARLFHLGYAVVPIDNDPDAPADEQIGLDEEALAKIATRIRRDIARSPEYIPDAVGFDTMHATPRPGAFAAQAVAGGLHGSGTRYVLNRAIPVQQRLAAQYVAEARTKTPLPQNVAGDDGAVGPPAWLAKGREVRVVANPDRVAVRQSYQVVTKEGMHRDEYTTAVTKAEQHFGGWVSVACTLAATGKSTDQTFLCVPASQPTQPRDTATAAKGAFTKLSKKEVAFWAERTESIAVPNGCMLVFAHDMIHGVSGSRGKELTRVFLGMALGGADLAPAYDLERCLDQFGPGICTNGSQEWTNYEANHASIFAAAPPDEGKRFCRGVARTGQNPQGMATLAEWAKAVFKPEFLTVERESVKYPGLKYRLPPRDWTATVLWKAGDEGKPPFKAYTDAERKLREPFRVVKA
jgi:hypothetical protein